LDAFAEMYADPSVMCDLGGPISLEESRAKLLRYISMYEDFGFSRYCVEDVDGQFVGYVGVCPRDDGQTIGKNNEIDWRLRKDVWGKGYATEAASACVVKFNRVHPASEIISYTSIDNKRSQSVMTQLNMDREPSRGFQWRDPDGASTRMLVWVSNHLE
jgi:RimJ/RimL family protein N-acetyltransferase